MNRQERQRKRSPLSRVRGFLRRLRRRSRDRKPDDKHKEKRSRRRNPMLLL